MAHSAGDAAARALADGGGDACREMQQGKWWEDGREGSQKMEETFKIARKEKAKL